VGSWGKALIGARDKVPSLRCWSLFFNKCLNFDVPEKLTKRQKTVIINYHRLKGAGANASSEYASVQSRQTMPSPLYPAVLTYALRTNGVCQTSLADAVCRNSGVYRDDNRTLLTTLGHIIRQNDYSTGRTCGPLLFEMLNPSKQKDSESVPTAKFQYKYLR